MRPSSSAMWTGEAFEDVCDGPREEPPEYSANELETYRRRTDRLVEDRLFDNRYVVGCFRCGRGGHFIRGRQLRPGLWLCRLCEAKE